MEHIKLTFTNKEVKEQWYAGRNETANITTSIQNKVKKSSKTPNQSDNLQDQKRSRS